jgi:hypothetical protein
MVSGFGKFGVVQAIDGDWKRANSVEHLTSWWGIRLRFLVCFDARSLVYQHMYLYSLQRGAIPWFMASHASRLASFGLQKDDVSPPRRVREWYPLSAPDVLIHAVMHSLSLCMVLHVAVSSSSVLTSPAEALTDIGVFELQTNGKSSLMLWFYGHFWCFSPPETRVREAFEEVPCQTCTHWRCAPSLKPYARNSPTFRFTHHFHFYFPSIIVPKTHRSKSPSLMAAPHACVPFGLA